jgi:hypothetical protein
VRSHAASARQLAGDADFGRADEEGDLGLTGPGRGAQEIVESGRLFGELGAMPRDEGGQTAADVVREGFDQERYSFHDGAGEGRRIEATAVPDGRLGMRDVTVIVRASARLRPG